MKAAEKSVAKARAAAKQEKRKKTRMLKKASNLSATDLERIAVLKRTGLWDPSTSGPPQPDHMCTRPSTSLGSASSSAMALPAAHAIGLDAERTAAQRRGDDEAGEDSGCDMRDLEDDA